MKPPAETYGSRYHLFNYRANAPAILDEAITRPFGVAPASTPPAQSWRVYSSKIALSFLVDKRQATPYN
jgi:hypothetical protein